MAKRKEYKIRISEEGAKRVESSVERIGQKMKQVAVAAAAAFGTKLLFDFGKGALQVAGQFEALRVRLQNMYLSVQAGNRAFDTFNKLAAKTPFEILRVVEAGASLKAFGLDAEKTIGLVADLAAFMNEDIVSAASAMGRAFAGGRGAADVFREKGLLTIIDTKSGIDTTKVSIEEFREAMFKAFQDPSSGIIGATEKLSKTTLGMESNVKDAYQRLQNALGERLEPQYKETLQGMISVTEDLITVVNKIPEIEGDVDDFAQRLIGVLPGINILFSSIGVGVSLLHKYAEELREGEKNTALFQKMMDSFNNTVEEGDEDVDNFTQKIRAMERAINDSSISMRSLQDDFGGFRDLLEMGGFEIDPLERIMDFDAVQGEASVALGNIASDPGWDILKSKANQFSGILSTAIVNQWQRGESALNNFVASFKSAVAAMAAEILSRIAIFGLLNIFGVGGIFGGAGAAANFIFGGGRQHGGAVSPGTPYMVGEGGQPEIFVPTQSGRVEPTGSPVNITINAIDSLSVESWLKERKGAEMIVKHTRDIIG